MSGDTSYCSPVAPPNPALAPAYLKDMIDALTSPSNVDRGTLDYSDKEVQVWTLIVALWGALEPRKQVLKPVLVAIPMALIFFYFVSFSFRQ